MVNDVCACIYTELFLFVFRGAHILLDDFVVLYLDGKSSSLEETVDVPFRPFEVSNLESCVSTFDYSRTPITRTKSNFPWISPHFPVIFTWLT